MYTLRYKLPLEVMLNKPIEKNGYKTYKINMSDLKFNDINLDEIKNLDGQMIGLMYLENVSMIKKWEASIIKMF